MPGICQQENAKEFKGLCQADMRRGEAGEQITPATLDRCFSECEDRRRFGNVKSFDWRGPSDQIFMLRSAIELPPGGDGPIGDGWD